MPPQLAALICILLIFYLFWMDRKRIDGPSNALWIPLAWMFLAGSRTVSYWLEVRTTVNLRDAYTEGSPVDAAVFSLLILVGVIILFRRKVDWTRVLTQNKWIWLYFLYCGISITWSDFPFMTFKRWIKELGNPIMALVILTEKRPYEAAGVVLRRLAFLLLPLSVLFIKYYPELGRAYTPQGVQMFTGAGIQKNSLGQMCLISGIYLSWNFVLNRKKGVGKGRRDNITDLFLLGMVAWLLHMSRSATSLACLVGAASLIVMSRMTLIAEKPGRIIALLVVVASLFLILEATVDVSNFIFGILGRDESLTFRVPIWQELKGMVTNHIVGTGFMNFWTGERLDAIWAKTRSTIIQAHNGYLEQYLNLGYVGVAFIIVIILSGLLKVRRHLKVDYPPAMLRLCFIVTNVLYNYTEASFYGVNNMWLLLIWGVVDMSGQRESSRI